jgi:hypothetical protein
MVVLPYAKKAQNDIAAVSADGNTVTRLDPPLELLVQPLDGVRGPDRFPLAFREARKRKQLIPSLL